MASDKEVSFDLQVPEGFEAPPGWGPVALYPSTQQAHEAGLAILAMGHAYWLLPYEETYIICVATGKLTAVRLELEAVQKLGNQAVPQGRPAPYRELDVSVLSFVLYAVVLCGCFAAQFAYPLKAAGRVDAVRMMEGGEWWRAITSLTLHSDVVHLASNTVAGIGFAFLLARFFGAGAAWLLIMVTGAAGNALNAWIHYPEVHLSIGASTAVFAALGLITGIGLWVAVLQPAERWTMPRWLIPVFGGLTLLGLLGVGEGLDGRIDVAAHISGFLWGSIVGFLCATRQVYFLRMAPHTKWIGLLVFAIILAAWAAALR
ncbi:hypothetical protein DDZ13_14470 [Coraliomargarita sinensis]|uniref:Peptidase S54 rhomboid domain-containing protein n=1 Tax=Coraliomargarita sinensis TaxID=2174842 RepID=A0A317ZGC7_9BACT|nr:rhomboid family intramembrane serine protease [Coraliomargarita sinensis]PXA02988.1 hypothetical protein DDZ13_14470 [Coraliomargarita sinensis]